MTSRRRCASRSAAASGSHPAQERQGRRRPTTQQLAQGVGHEAFSRTRWDSRWKPRCATCATRDWAGLAPATAYTRHRAAASTAARASWSAPAAGRPQDPLRVLRQRQPGQLLLHRLGQLAPRRWRPAAPPPAAAAGGTSGSLQHPLDRVAQHLPVARGAGVCPASLLQRGQRPAGLDRVGAPAERLVQGVPQPREPGRRRPASGPARRCPAAGRRLSWASAKPMPYRSSSAQQPLPLLARHRARPGCGTGRPRPAAPASSPAAARTSCRSASQSAAVSRPASVVSASSPTTGTTSETTRRSSAACCAASGPATGHGSPAPPTSLSTLLNTPSELIGLPASRADDRPERLQRRARRRRGPTG